jgi:orotidine-5'-phosphate decarboxylase
VSLPFPLDHPLAVALDTVDLQRLDWLAGQVAPHAGLLKVGLEAFTAHGPTAFRAAAAHGPVFADLKLHDIPATVAGAVHAAGDHEVGAMTVHAAGGAEMVGAAVEAVPEVAVLAVTVLTSLADGDLAALGLPDAASQVPRLAALAVEAGAAGVVCAPAEIAAVRQAVGADPLVVTPGVRSVGEHHDDQRRVATPAEARAAGADVIVVGRPITRASDPAGVAKALADGWVSSGSSAVCVRTPEWYDTDERHR